MRHHVSPRCVLHRSQARTRGAGAIAAPCEASPMRTARSGYPHQTSSIPPLVLRARPATERAPSANAGLCTCTQGAAAQLLRTERTHPLEAPLEG
eukprot:6857042-Prymnesium_polylepis.2